MAGDMIPPAIIEVLGDDKSFLATMARDSALLADWAKTDTTTKLGADPGSFQRTIAQAQSELLAFGHELTKARLGADSARFWSDIAALRAEISAMSPLDINIDANLGAALAKIAALRGVLADASLGSLLGSVAGGSGGGGGGGGGFWSSLLGGFFGRDGGGSGSGGILAALGIGTGAHGLLSRIPWLGGLLGNTASFGGLGSLLGLGPERIIGGGLGIAGSMAGGVLGGGILGLGALGVGAVGMGTDMAGMGQAAGDIRTVTSDMSALNQAIGVYGKGSIQAATAQAQLNYDLSNFNPVARQAVLQAALMAQGFRTEFDKVTGQAEKTGAQIIGQFIGVAEKFLPTIGRFAGENMAIIQKSLQPLASWLTGPGLAIFTNLERVFQRDLPAGMSIFVNGLELLMKVVNIASGYLGHFIDAIANKLKSWNTTDFSHFAGEIRNLISLFFTWAGLIFAIGKDIYDVFKPAVGFGKDFAKQFTDVFNQIGKWLKSSGIQEALHSLFSAHLDQFNIIMGAVKDMLPVLEAFLGAWIRIETIVTRVANAVLGPLIRMIGDLLKNKVVSTILGWGTAFFVAAGAIGGFIALIGAIGSAIGGMVMGIAGGIGGLVAVVTDPVFLVIAAIALLAVGIYELATHWHQVWGDIKNWTADAVAFVKAHMYVLAAGLSLLLGPMGLLVFAAMELWLHWRTVWGAIGPIVKTAAAVVMAAVHIIVAVVKGAWATIAGTTRGAWAVVGGVVKAGIAVVVAAVTIGVDLVKAAWDLLSGATRGAWDLIMGVIKGAINIIIGIFKFFVAVLTGNWSAAWNTIKSTAKRVWNDITSGLEGFWKSIVSGFRGALDGAIGAVWTGLSTIGHAFSSVKGTVTHAFDGAIGWLESAGHAIIQGLINGVTSAATSLYHTLSGVASKAKSFITDPWSIFSPSRVAFGYGQMIIQGLALGVASEGPTAYAALANVSNRMRTVPFVAPSVGRGGYGGYGVNATYNVTIYAGAGANGQQIGMDFRKAMQAHDDDLIRRLSAGTVSSAAY